MHAWLAGSWRARVCVESMSYATPNDRDPMVAIDAVPPSVVHAGATAISAGGFHSMVLKHDGAVCVTGNNDDGQFGDGTTTSSNVLKRGPCGTMV